MSGGLKEYGVLFSNSKLYSPALQREDQQGFQEHLRKLHQNKLEAWCPCQTRAKPRIFSRLRGRTYHPVKESNSGPRHSFDCTRYSLPNDFSGRGTYTVGVVEETKHGIQITFREPMTRRPTPAESTGTGLSRVSGSGRTQSRMSPRGLLDYFWTEASLNRWHPNMAGKRSWGVVARELNKAAEPIRLNGVPLSEYLMVLEPDLTGSSLHASTRRFIATAKRLAAADRGDTPRVLIIVEIQAVHRDIDGTSLDIGASWSGVGLRVHVDEHGFEVLKRGSVDFRRLAENAPIHDRGEVRLVALLQIEISGQQGDWIANVQSGAVSAMTAQFIPYASDYERRFTRDLIAEERWFIKPLRYDAAEVVFPDALLLDGKDRPRAMEVYGRNGDPVYRKRKETKTALYADGAAGAQPWVWDVPAGADPWTVKRPPFPQRVIHPKAKQGKEHHVGWHKAIPTNTAQKHETPQADFVRPPLPQVPIGRPAFTPPSAPTLEQDRLGPSYGAYESNLMTRSPPPPLPDSPDERNPIRLVLKPQEPLQPETPLPTSISLPLWRRVLKLFFG
nr:DUF1173 family protein [Azospirillum formosense]